VAHMTSSGVTIRRAGISDAPALARLRWRWRTAERGEHGLSEMAFEATFVEWWGRRQDSHTAYIAEVDGEAAGMAWIAVFDRIPQPRDMVRLAGNVQSVYVLDDLRNRGIGRALVEAVIEEARMHAVGYLIVHPSQRAYSLYERLGFDRTDALLYMDLDGEPAAPPE
jgi:GNAT superfamily N-acetyltransferase